MTVNLWILASSISNTFSPVPIASASRREVYPGNFRQVSLRS